jgi:putative nucleotidyltransferase with HDIG domain
VVRKEIHEILKILDGAGFEVAVVGGGVRDFLAGRDIGDWDLTTNAKPEEILKLFPNGFYNNRFGTVGIPIEQGAKKDRLIVEVTTYRTEESYSDTRHPDKVVWGNSLEEDLARRDFTINAMALRFAQGKLSIIPLDPFGGQSDLKSKTIRAVGLADERFKEDALRMLRAIRFATILGFEIESKTAKAIEENAHLISKISGERIRDEVFKIVQSRDPASGFFLAKKLGVLTVILPELEVCFLVEQKSPKRHHIYDVGTHCVMSLASCPSSDTATRFATLLHDIGKAKVAKVTEEGVRTFHNHEVVGARLATKIAERFHFSREERDKLFRLVRWHQFSVGENQTDRALRRFIKNVGLEYVEDMMDLRIGDRLGGGLQQPESWRLKLFRQRLKEVLKKPFTVSDLKVNGRDVMEILKISPGPKVGEILNKLFEEVLDDAKKNNGDYLLRRLEDFK